ncbi:MAG: choice-of-anchor D domain-containing protein [Chloroflexi bacterium]|nr:choice-of-anchor D domain-containing protein [Chloroflexota bacterium]
MVVTNINDVANGDTSSPARLIADPGADGISLREAIEAATHDSDSQITVTFAPALQGETISLTAELPLVDSDGVHLNGDIDADGQPDITIDGNGLSRPAFRIFNASYIIVEGFIITHFDDKGVAIENYNGGDGSEFSNITIRNNTVMNVTRNGVELLLTGVSSSTIRNVEISGNTIQASGGGIGVYASAADGDSFNTLANIAIISNTIQNFGSVREINIEAGGVYADNNQNNTIDGLIIRGNTISGSTDSTILIGAAKRIGCVGNRVQNVQISHNYIDGTPVTIEILSVGGGDASVSLNTTRQFTITDNILVNGGIHFASASANGPSGNVISDILIERNQITLAANNGVYFTAGDSGAVYNRLERVVLRDNRISRSGDAGILLQGRSEGAYNAIHSVTIVNNTLIDNGLGSGWAGGISINSLNSTNTITNVVISSTILWGNEGSDAIRGSVTPTSVSYSLLNDARFAAINGNIYENPLFANPANGDFSLAAESPALDSGDPAAVNAGDLDIAGRVRQWDGDGIDGARVDMGAWEYASPQAPALLLQGLDTTIYNADYVPSPWDGTSFGTYYVGDEGISRTFTISNTGALPLNLTGSPISISGAHAADFTILTQPAQSIASGAASTFTIAFAPSQVGVRSALVSIISDAPDANPFTFAIQGIAVLGNAAPTEVVLSYNAVAENEASGTEVGNLSSVDPNVGDTHTYALVDEADYPDNTAFAVDGSALETANVLDHESQDSYVIKIRSTDSGGLQVAQVFTITVLDRNEAPTAINLSSSIVAENQMDGTPVGTFSAVDADEGDTHSYALVEDWIYPGNVAFVIDGAVLKTAQMFNYETQNNYIVKVRSTDSGGLQFTQEFSVMVQDVNDAPVALSQSVTTTINVPLQITLGASDEDGNALTWDVHDPANGTLSGDKPNLTYTPGNGFAGTDYFTFEASDGLQSSCTATVTIRVSERTLLEVYLPIVLK